MNLLECTVTAVLIEAYEAHGKWFVGVSHECYGRTGGATLMFNTEEEARSVGIGHKFMS